MRAGSAAGLPPGRWLPRTAAGAVLALALAGCGTAKVAETAREVPDTLGVDGTVGQIRLDDVYLSATGSVAIGASLPLLASLTNVGAQPDELLRVTTPAAQAVTLLDADGRPAVSLALPGDGQIDGSVGSVRLRLSDLTAALRPAQVVAVTFVFARAGTVVLDVPLGPSS